MAMVVNPFEIGKTAAKVAVEVKETQLQAAKTFNIMKALAIVGFAAWAISKFRK